MDIESQINALAEEATVRQLQKTKQLLDLVAEQAKNEDWDAAYLEEQFAIALAEEFKAGVELASNNSDAQDASLFRLWIDMAHREPGRVVNALMYCIRPEDYRKALLGLISQPSKGEH